MFALRFQFSPGISPQIGTNTDNLGNGRSWNDSYSAQLRLYYGFDPLRADGWGGGFVHRTKNYK